MINTKIQSLNLFINSPLEQFEITALFGFTAPLLNYFNLTFTNLGLYTLLTFSLIVSLHLIVKKNIKILPSS
jgi:F-type H+-transporting ATPase subunit a